MLRNHFKIAWRNVLRRKLFSGINLTGLTLGIVTALLISIYVVHELDYDRFHEKAENTYMIRHNYFMGEQDYDWHETALPLAEHMKAHFPEVEHLTSTTAPSSYSFRYEDRIVDNVRTLHADGEFFDVFGFRLLAGNPQKALLDPSSIVISQQTALQLFENPNESRYEEVLGKTLIYDEEAYLITGIVATPAGKSHLQFDAIVPIHELFPNAYIKGTWLPAGIINYVVLKEGVDPDVVTSRFKQLEEDFLWDQLNKHLGTSLSKLENNRAQYGYYLEPILDIHLVRQGNLKYVLIFSAVGFLILLLVLTNFVNLFISTAATRIKEVGVRKALGARKSELAKQFFIESTLLCTLAFVLAMLAVPLVITSFNDLVGTDLSLTGINSPFYGLSLLALWVTVIICSSAYPAFYLSSVGTAKAVKGDSDTNSKSNIQKPLIVFQYAVSMGLVISFLSLFEQVDFMRQKDLGFDKENVVVIPGANFFGTNQQAFKQKLTSHAAIREVSFSYSVPGGTFDALSLYKKEGENQDFQFYWMNADHDFLHTYNIEVVEGRAFSEDFPTDTAAVVLNEAAANQIGRKGLVDSYLTNHFRGKVKVIGVIENFNFEHLKHEVKPLAIALSHKESYHAFVSVKLGPGNPQQALEYIEAQWVASNPEASFQYSFLDDRLDRLYQVEERTGKIVSLFTALAVFISGFGLFGLITLSTTRRTKEVGIRKTLGASAWEITYLLSKEFLMLIIIAFVITVPFTYWALDRWLREFANRIELGLDTFFISGIAVLFVSGLIISYQTVRTALMNPVKSLRSE